MKKLSLIAAALTSALVISMAGVPASAAANEQYVTVEDGVTVVHVIVYVEPDSAIKGSEVVSYDANGTKYVYTYKVRPQSPEDGISSSVTWKDASGNTYVMDGQTKTMTVYDADGNITAVYPAK